MSFRVPLWLTLLLLFPACSKRTDPELPSLRGNVILEGDRDHSRREGSFVYFGNSTRNSLTWRKDILILSILLSQRTELEHRFAVEVATPMPATDGSFELKDVPESDQPLRYRKDV